MTRSTPGSPSRPISRTPSGSPIAPIAVVSSPGITLACTPPAWSRSTTASICAGVASGVITTITRNSRGERSRGHVLSRVLDGHDHELPADAPVWLGYRALALDAQRHDDAAN